MTNFMFEYQSTHDINKLEENHTIKSISKEKEYDEY
jgi:hypothetical protein